MARAVEPKRNPVARVLTAAALRIRADKRGRINKPQTEAWQSDAWDMFDLIPEVGQAVTFIANVVSGVRLFVALQPMEAEDEPMAAPEGTPGLAEARDMLERLRSGSAHGGIAGLLATSVKNLKVAGDCWLLGEPARAGDPEGKTAADRVGTPERWSVKSIDEVKFEGSNGEVRILDAPGATGGRTRKVAGTEGVDPDDEDAVLLIRVYDPHPRYSALARSSMRHQLELCDELLMLSRAIRSAARSRYAGAGILGIADTLDVADAPAGEGDETENPEVTPFMRKLSNAMVAPISDEGNPDGVVPIVVVGPLDAVKEGINLVKLSQQFDPEVREIRKELVHRLGTSGDIPVESAEGISGVNHWGAWQISGSEWARYGQPTTRLIVDSWTEGLLRPALEEANVDFAAAQRLMIWFDAADAIMDPDESKTADELIDRKAIGFESYRRRKGAGDDEAPTDEDWTTWERIAAMKPAQQSGSPNETGPPNDGEVPAATAAANGHSNGHAIVAAPKVSRGTLGERLMRIDQALRLRLMEAAEASLRKALERAGAKARSRAEKDQNVAAAVKGTPVDRIVAKLGESVVAALGLTTDDLLDQLADDFGPRFDQRVRQAQAAVRREMQRDFDLDDVEMDELERKQDRDRAEAWVWLSAALVSLAAQRLYNPQVVAPTQGESDPSTSIPVGLIREAMARAGGGVDAQGPSGGVGLGQLVMDTWAKHGRVIGGYEWVHGDPAVPLDGHLNLDGVPFANWEDPVLMVAPEDDWIGSPTYFPGDHANCSCSWVVLSPDDLAPTDDERTSDLMRQLEEVS